ncbi:MAG: lysyl oxidase family protein [Pseudomonadota bacterium]
MRALGAGLALVLVAAATGALAAQAPTRAQRIVFDRGGSVLAAAPDGSARAVLARGADPAVAPDGARVAFVRGGETFVLDGATRRTTRARRGIEPAYSPDGKLAVVVDGRISVDGAAPLAEGRSPAWTPDGRSLVFSSNREGSWDLWRVDAAGGDPLRLTSDPGDELAPAVSPDGSRIAYATGRGIAVLDATGTRPLELPLQAPGAPAWSPDGSRLVVEAGGFAGTTLVTVDLATLAVSPLRGSLPGDAHPTWAALLRPPPRPEPPPRPDPNELLPDLDQRAPHALVVGGGPGRWTLGFASAVDNVGRGPLWLRGTRRTLFATRMDADQVVRLRTGGTRLVRKVGWIRYTADAPHFHWHVMDFDRYELRRADDFSLVVRDHKTGFCLADHYGHAGARVRVAAPFFLGSCRQFEPRAQSVEQGTSVGYTDRYPANFHGQNVELTDVPAGIYVLVHRANPTGRIRELDLANNAASVRLRIGWPHGRGHAPSVVVLRRCDASERCPPRR